MAPKHERDIKKLQAVVLPSREEADIGSSDDAL